MNKNILFLVTILFAQNVYTTTRPKEKNPYYYAIKNNHVASVEKLIEKGIEVDMHTGYEGEAPGGCIDGETPLIWAVKEVNIPIIKLLIDAGADVNWSKGFGQPSMGKPVLSYAIDSGSLQVVALLLEAGARSNDFTASAMHGITSSGNTRNLSMLSHAVRIHASSDIIKTLINAGACINGNPYHVYVYPYNLCTWTPLMIAAFQGNYEAVELLLSMGADLRLANKSDNNNTALHYARLKGHKKIEKLLLDQMSTFKKLLYTYIL